MVGTPTKHFIADHAKRLHLWSSTSFLAFYLEQSWHFILPVFLKYSILKTKAQTSCSIWEWSRCSLKKIIIKQRNLKLWEWLFENVTTLAPLRTEKQVVAINHSKLSTLVRSWTTKIYFLANKRIQAREMVASKGQGCRCMLRFSCKCWFFSFFLFNWLWSSAKKMRSD